jgi:hypothetical protein
MAIDPTQPNLGSVARERPMALPGDQIVTSQGVLDQLQIPKDALDPKNVIPFLANQSARLLEITARPAIKTESADVPPPLDTSDPSWGRTELTGEESSALAEWHQERSAALLKSQSGGADLGTAADSGSSLDDLKKEIGDYVGKATAEHPELFHQSSGGSTADVLDQWMMGKMLVETDEQKKRYHELLAMASHSGNPDNIILAITSRHAAESMTKIGQLMGFYKEKSDAMDKLRAQIDLDGSKASQSTMMKDNMAFSGIQGDMMNLFQVIQKEMNNYESTMQMSQSEIKSRKDLVQQMQGNLKAT